jgi:hypothetical protein
MNEIYIEKLISLIKQGLITVNDIKNATYKAEVEKRLNATT